MQQIRPPTLLRGPTLILNIQIKQNQSEVYILYTKLENTDILLPACYKMTVTRSGGLLVNWNTLIQLIRQPRTKESFHRCLAIQSQETLK